MVMFTSAMDVLTYPCGTSITERNDDNDSQYSDSIYSVVYVRKNLNCQSPVEVTYYSTGYPDIYCCSDDILNGGSKDYYPICQICVTAKKEKIKKRVKGRKKCLKLTL